MYLIASLKWARGFKRQKFLVSVSSCFWLYCFGVDTKFKFLLKACKCLKKKNDLVSLKYFKMDLICIEACFSFFVTWRWSLHCLFYKSHYFCVDFCLAPWYGGCMYVFWTVCFCVFVIIRIVVLVWLLELLYFVFELLNLIFFWGKLLVSFWIAPGWYSVSALKMG